MVSALAPLLAERDDTTWVAAAIGDDDRAALDAGAVGDAAAPIDLRLLPFEAREHRLHYDVVSNGVLWFLLHGLFDLVRRPRFDRRFREAWEAYVAVNRAFADAVAELAAEGETVLVQDYQLSLVPHALGERRPDVRVVHFTHTPFCGPSSIRVLPEYVGRALCGSLAARPAGFHTERWARAYTAAAREVLGVDAPLAPTFAASFGPDATALEEAAASPAVQVAAAALDETVGDRLAIVRSDRVDPSKNIVRGFRTFDLLLEERPEWRERVVFVALLSPSREQLPEYLAYRQEVEQAAARVNGRWGRADWTPVILDTRDDIARSLSGFARADVLFVNPVKDGLNLVALEAPIVNRRDAALCLSREAGAFDLVGEWAVALHPFDLVQGAAALHEALSMPRDERAERAARVRRGAAASPPRVWLERLLSHATP